MEALKRITGAVAVVTVICVAPAMSAEKPFFERKVVSVMIGYGAGGTYNRYGRMLARYLGKHIPGHPTVVTKNVPGAGSVKLANTLYNVGPKDGTAIGLVGFALPVQQVLGSKGYRFEAAKFNWIGRLSAGAGAIVSRAELPIKAIEDVKKTRLFIASPGRSTASSLYATLLNRFIGTKFKIVYGYRGTQETVLAMERGEVGAVQLALTDPRFVGLMNEKKINALVQVTVTRQSSLPDVPTAVELVKDPEDRKVMELFSLVNDIGRSFFLPPEVPADRVKVWRESFMKTVGDPELIAFSEKARLPISPMRGEDLQKIITNIGKTPRTVIDKAVAARESKAAD